MRDLTAARWIEGVGTRTCEQWLAVPASQSGITESVGTNSRVFDELCAATVYTRKYAMAC